MIRRPSLPLMAFAVTIVLVLDLLAVRGLLDFWGMLILIVPTVLMTQLLINLQPVGTRSLLVGVHQFVWHPWTVGCAWRHLYGRWPIWQEWICIVVHDWGYWGCAEMDGPEGTRHPHRGAHIATLLVGQQYHLLVLLHSRTLSRRFELEPSKLCWPDKASIAFDPVWFYLLRARLTGEIREYHLNAIETGFVPHWSTDRDWLLKLREVSLEDSERESLAHIT